MIRLAEVTNNRNSRVSRVGTVLGRRSWAGLDTTRRGGRGPIDVEAAREFEALPEDDDSDIEESSRLYDAHGGAPSAEVESRE